MSTLQKVIKYCALALAAGIIISMLAAFSGLAGLLGFIAKPDEESVQTVGDLQPVESYSELCVEVTTAALDIRVGSDFAVSKSSESITVTKQNGTLLIEQRRAGILNGGAGTVVITVPEKHVFDKVEIETGTGRTNIQSLSAHSLELSLGVGNVNIESLSVDKTAEIECGVGTLAIADGEINNLDAELGVGAASIRCKLAGGSVECGIGELKLSLIGSASDYCISADKGVGNMYIGGEKINSDCVVGSGSNSLKLEGAVGSVSVEFDGN